MWNQPRTGIARQLLFPYSGEEELTLRQGLRVIMGWILTFGLGITICTLPIVAWIYGASWQKMAILLLFAFGSGAVIFGGLAWLIVAMNNQSARIRQKWREQHAARTSGTSGGRYGS